MMNSEKDITEVLEGEVIKAIGRPSKYDDSMIKTMLDAKEMGASDTQIMKVLGVSRDTFYRWLRENDDFKDAHDYGKLAEELHWDKVAEVGILNPKAINTNLYIAYMKKRFPSWRDSATASGGANTTINVGTLTVNNLKTLSAGELEEEIAKRLHASEHKKLEVTDV